MGASFFEENTMTSKDYGSSSKKNHLRSKFRRKSSAAIDELSQEFQEIKSYGMIVLRTLTRFYQNTRVLEVVIAGFLLALCFGLFYGMKLEKWSFTTSLFFYMYTIATVGYGYTGKRSAVNFGLLSVYIFVSVLAVSLLLGLFVAALNDISEIEVKQQLREERRLQFFDQINNNDVDNENPSSKKKDPESSIEQRSRVEVEVAFQQIISSFIRFFIVGLIGVLALVFLDNGNDFTYLEAILFTLETVTTVGFGTSRIDTPAAKWFVIIFIPVGCGTWARFVAAVSRFPLVIRKRNELLIHIKALRSDESQRGISPVAARYLLDSHLRLNSFANVSSIFKTSSKLSQKQSSTDRQSSDNLIGFNIMSGWWDNSPTTNTYDEGLPLVQPPTLAAAHQADVQRDSLRHSLNQQEFIIHWLLATNQVSLQDVMDARDFFNTLDVDHSGVLHLPTFFSDATTSQTFDEQNTSPEEYRP